MRVNKFGECYCHTAAEARVLIDDHGGSVYVPGVEREEDGYPATAEIADNETGDLVCYIEAPTEATVRAIIAELAPEIA